MRAATRRLGVVGAVWLAVALACHAAEQQDSWAGVERIVAVGDVHGDFEQFVKVLHAAEVIDEKNDWAAGKTHLVQTGDVLDRGPDSRKAMDLLMRLEAQAAKAGGAVHALIGNHEAMMLLDDWRYLHPGEAAAFGGADAYRKALSAEGVYGKWIRSHNTAIRINDILFVHAGLTPSCAKFSLREINEAVRKELAAKDEEGLAMRYAGPLWDRSMALGDDDELAKELEPVLKKYEAARMVVGHTPSREGVVVRAGGRLIRIDVGMCEYYGGPAACLVIEKGAFYEVRHPKGKKRLELAPPAQRPAARPAA